MTTELREDVEAPARTRAAVLPAGLLALSGFLLFGLQTHVAGYAVVGVSLAVAWGSAEPQRRDSRCCATCP